MASNQRALVLGLAGAIALALFPFPLSAQRTRPAIDSIDIKSRIRILSSDSLEGRRSGELGGNRAAQFIASEFKRLSLKTFDSAKNYFQYFDFSERALDTTRTGRTYTQNVVGYLLGTIKNEYVVVGAHYDHLGYGGKNSLDTSKKPAIHYGADDNASGASAVIELAEYFAKRKPKRSIIFITFSGEEEGLFGSMYFAKHSLVDLKNIRAMINMDMVGRLKDSILIVEGLGSSPRLREIVTATHKPKQFNLRLKDAAVGPSDHTSFYRVGIPVLFFFTGLHKDYHRPSDTWEKINYSGEEQVLRFVAKIIERIANDKEGFPYSNVPEDTTQKVSTFRVYVGGVPDYGYEGSGVKISMVTPGSPAEKAGIYANDVILEFGGKKIGNIYDYTGALSNYKPGDVVEAVVARGDQRMVLSVTLGTRAADH